MVKRKGYTNDLVWVIKLVFEKGGGMMVEVKSCPFCGATPKLYDDKNSAYIYCPICRACSTPFENEAETKGIYIEVAITAWNRRTDTKTCELTKEIKYTGKSDQHYWKLIDERLKRNGIRY